MGQSSRGVPTFFETAEAFAGWLEKHGAAKSELIVGYYKRGTQRRLAALIEASQEKRRL
jgi:hypothetical protein